MTNFIACFNAINSMRNTRSCHQVFCRVPQSFNAINSMRNTREKIMMHGYKVKVSTLLIACAIRAIS